MDEDAAFILEHKTREEFEDAAAKVGLHMEEWQIIDIAEAKRRMRDADHDHPENDLGGDEGAIVRAVFQIGDLAFAPHILDPNKDAEDKMLTGLEVDMDHDAIIDAARPGGGFDALEAEIDDL